MTSWSRAGPLQRGYTAGRYPCSLVRHEELFRHFHRRPVVKLDGVKKATEWETSGRRFLFVLDLTKPADGRVLPWLILARRALNNADRIAPCKLEISHF